MMNFSTGISWRRFSAGLDIKVRSAKDGVAALRLLEDEPADLLTDIRMPGMGGLKLLHKAKEKWPAMPVVMVTAYASVESAVESMRQGPTIIS